MIASRLPSWTPKTSLKNVTIQYYLITYKGIHRIPSQHLPQSKSTKIPSNFRWVHHIFCFSHPNDKSDLSCLFLFQGSNHCINLFLRMPDAGVFGKMGYVKRKETMWFKLKKKRKVEQHWFTLFRIHIYIHRICKLRKKTITNQRLLLSLGRNLKQKLWDVEIFNCWMSNQDQHFIRSMVQTSGDHHLECQKKKPVNNGMNYHIQLVQGFLPSTVDSTCGFRERCFFDVSLTMTKPSSLASKARVFKRSSWCPAWTTNNNK